MRQTTKSIVDEFNDAEDELGEDKSTEYLASITAEKLGIDYMTVINALAEYALQDVEESR